MDRKEIFDCEEFYERVINQRQLFQELIEELTVSQSFFFREREHFEILAQLAKDASSFHILSAPCANGEEPYSLAMVLMERGFENFRIDAVDISAQAIQRAREGIYSDRSIEFVPDRFKKSYFYKSSNGYEVQERVRQKVHFVVGNIFELDGVGCYDVIFCRNFFIYLDNYFTKKALELFHRLLKKDGYLFVSFSDYLREHDGFDKILVANKEFYKRR